MLEAPQKILVIRLSSIGDIVNALPAVAALGKTFPAAEIIWAVESRYACLLEGNPYVRRTIQLDTLSWRKRLGRAVTWREIIACARELRETRFDAVVDLQGLVKTGIIAWLCRSDRRVGFARYTHREPGAGIFYTETVMPPATGHVIGEYMALVRRLGAEANCPWEFPLPSPPAAERAIHTALAAAGVADFTIVNPGGGWLAKRWPPASYAALIARLESAVPGRVVLSGSPSEEPVIGSILGESGAGNAVYIPASIPEFIVLVRKAKLFIGGDTGPMHLAAALRIPIVAIYGPTDPARNGPFSPADIALTNHSEISHSRRAPGQKFIEDISVDDVLAAVRERMARAAGEGA